MDSNQARDGSARQVPSEPTLTAYQGAADGSVAAQPSAFNPNLDPWTSGSLHLDSQSRSLRQASLALDTAYERITHLRNSINNLLNRMPPEITGSTTSITNTNPTSPRRSLTHDSSAALRPPHSALVLSDEQIVEDLNVRAARLRSLIPPSARQRLEEFESTSRNGTRREFVWDRFSHGGRTGSGRGDAHLPVPRPRTPPMPDIVVPRTRDLQSFNRDDSSTMIGRRVAARVSLNTNPSESHGSVSTRPSLSQIEQRLQAQTAQIAQELENMTDRLASQRSRRVELAPSSARRGTAAASPAGDASASTTSTAWPPPIFGDVSAEARLRPLPPNGGRPLRPPRDAIDNTTHIPLPPPISRTPSDVFSFEDFVTPTARRSLSAAYREHIATISQDSPRNLANSPEVRGTLVSLLRRDRGEQVLAARRVAPGRVDGVANRRDDLSARSNSLPHVGQTRRRRGRTRLNADGDEIDSEEDDNVSPHTRRLRMRFAYGPPSADSSAAQIDTVTIEDILWRTAGSDSEPDVLSFDEPESCPSLFQSSPPPVTAHYPNPLPSPVEEMLDYPTVKPPQQSQTIRVSKYASFAGR